MLRSHERRQFIADNFHHLLARRQAAHDVLSEGLLTHPLHKVLDDLKVDVRFQKRQPDFARRLFDVGFRQPAASAQVGKNAVEFCRKGFKHTASSGIRRSVVPQLQITGSYSLSPGRRGLG